MFWISVGIIYLHSKYFHRCLYWIGRGAWFAFISMINRFAIKFAAEPIEHIEILSQQRFIRECFTVALLAGFEMTLGFQRCVEFYITHQALRW